MRYAEMGYHLEVDLATGNVEKVETDPKLTELYLGGLATGVKQHWDRVPPQVEPFDDENILIFNTGLFCGTPAFGANRTAISFISPQTELLAYPMMGGFWAPELKHAGYDKIIFSNKSPDWVYLWVKNDKVEIRDARHLKGKGSVEVQDLIRHELNEPNAQVAAIGVAGENRCFTASIEQGRSSASRLGGGAIMGDKKIKAVAVRGTEDVHLADGARFFELLQGIKEYINFRNANPIPGVMTILSGLGSPQEMLHTDEKWHTESFSWGNARQRRKGFWTEDIEKSWTSTQLSTIKRLISCYNCPQRCAGLIDAPNVPRYMMKCFSKLTYGMAAYVDNLAFSFRVVQKAQQYGVDGFSTPQILAFAIELKEHGILTDKDFDGCPPDEDKEGRFMWLLDRLAHREGIGDILADGTYWAAKRIGKGAEEYAHNNIKKHEQMPIKLGMLDPIYYLMYSTGAKINITQTEGNWPQAAFPTREQRERFVEDWPQLPDEKFKEWLLEWEPRGEKSIPHFPTAPMCSEIVDWIEMLHVTDDALGLCAGLASFSLKPPYHINNYPELISAATGMHVDRDELKRKVNRGRNLHRAINNRRGMSRKDEKPPENHWRQRFPELEAELLTTYYAYKGWNYDGIPTRARLEELDLGYVADDLERRGILKNGQGQEDNQNDQG